jgi:phage I-like protein
MQRQIAVALDAKSAGERPTWNQIARVGQWAGHPSGPFQLTPGHFEEIVRNFKSTTNKRIPVDFEHASEQDPTRGEIPTLGAPAQAWIVDLDNRGAGGLWGLFEWLEPARTYVREGKYRFFSPTIRFGSRDPVTGVRGCRMSSGALTNQPFLDGMQPLAASARASQQDNTMIVEVDPREIQRLVSQGRAPDRARMIAMKNAAAAVARMLREQPSEIDQLADRVRAGEENIVTLANKIAASRGNFDREGAFGEAERMIRTGQLRG